MNAAESREVAGRTLRRVALNAWPLRDAGGVLGRLLFALLVAAPLLGLLLQTGRSLAIGEAAAFAAALPSPRRLTLLAQSTAFAMAVAISASAIGSLLGIAAWQCGARLSAALQWGVWWLAALPPYLHALAWSALAQELRQTFQAAGFQVGVPAGWWAAYGVQTMAMLPLASGLAWLALDSLERPLLDAARTLRSDGSVLAWIALPIAAPMLAASTGVIFVLVLTDYSVPSLYGVTSYAMEVFAEFSASQDPIRALIVAAPALLIGTAVLFALQAVLRDAATRPARSDHAWAAPPQWPTALRVVLLMAVASFAAACAVVLLSVLVQVGSTRRLLDTLAAAQAEIGVSLRVALGTALACLAPAVAMAAALQRHGARNAGWWVIATVPLAIPAPLQGIGLVAWWNRPLGLDVYGTEPMLVLAGAARFAPVAALLVLAQIRRTDPALVEAARILDPGPARTWLWIRLPLLAPGLVAAFGATFALTLGELGASLIVTPPGRATLTMRIYNYLHYGAPQEVAGLCLILIAVAGVAGLLALWLARTWSKLCSGAAAAR